MKSISTKRLFALGLVILIGCGKPSEERVPPATGGEGHDHSGAVRPSAEAPTPSEGAHVYYTCPMHPSVHSLEPGQCPICGMDLVAVTRGAEQDPSVTLDAERAQLIGVRTALVEPAPAVAEIRTVGRVVYDETRLADVTLKVDGWVETLYADATGKRVAKGEPLFTLYSPDLLAAQHELLAALASRRAAAGGGAPDRADYLVEAARERLALSGIDEATIDAIARSGKARDRVDILSPVDGVIVEKGVVAGTRAEAGMRLLRIADISRVWVEADLYERDAPSVAVGDRAEVRIRELGDRVIDGSVSFVVPWLEDTTRTARARIEVDNVDLDLKPDMYADVVFTRDLGVRLAIPATAVLYAGDKRYVFVDRGERRFEPRSVILGARIRDYVVIESGLHGGERVVTSGNFLIAAESRLKVALEDWK